MTNRRVVSGGNVYAVESDTNLFHRTPLDFVGAVMMILGGTGTVLVGFMSPPSALHMPLLLTGFTLDAVGSMILLIRGL